MLGVESQQQQEQWDRDDKETAYNRVMEQILYSGKLPSDSDLAAVGMTKDQAKAYQQAYNESKTTTSGNGKDTTSNSGTTYKSLPDPGSDAYGYIVKAIQSATSLDELNGITMEYINVYGKDAIMSMWAFKKKVKELSPTQKSIDPTSSPGGPLGIYTAQIK